MFWKPSVTTQFKICPVPYHMDTYRGCVYGCLFCFARDLTEFARRNKQGVEKEQFFLVGNRPDLFRNWVSRIEASTNYDYTHAEEVAFKERIPIKIGATADPFPIIERKEHITYDVLKILSDIDYPTQISTKNPEIFLEYADEFKSANIALNVSCSFCDDDIASKIEKRAIPPSRRFEAIRKLSDMGYKVLVRLQPFILPYAYDNAERFVKMIKDSGAWGFQTEGLKLRVTMPQKEREIYSEIGKVFGFDIIEYFKNNGVIEGGDRVYNNHDKDKILTRFTELADKYGIKFYNADNTIDSKYGCGCECCGTEFLRNRRIWGGSLRARVFSHNLSSEDVSHEFGKCLCNFTRSKKFASNTIEYVTDKYCTEVVNISVPSQKKLW